MVRRIYATAFIVGALLLATIAMPMVDLNEEFSATPEQDSSGVITESAALSESQKKAIQLALTKIFADQIASTSVYTEIVGALASAVDTPEVTESSRRFVVGLKDLVKVFFKNMKLSGEQLAKVRDLLETLKALAILQMAHFDPQTIDDAVRNQISALQERLSAHIMPLSVGMQGVLSQEMVNAYQKHILQVILDVIKDVLIILPPGSQAAGAGNPPPLAEPLIPQEIAIAQEQEFDAE